MDFSNVAVEAMAYALPPEIVSSDALEERRRFLADALGSPPDVLVEDQVAENKHPGIVKLIETIQQQ